jgi:hypothetical protein
MERAYSHHSAIYTSTHIAEFGILTAGEFANMVSSYKKAASARITTYKVLEVEGRGQSVEDLAQKLKPLVRSNDYVGAITDSDTKLSLLLTSTNDDSIDFVCKRLNDAGLVIKEVSV